MKPIDTIDQNVKKAIRQSEEIIKKGSNIVLYEEAIKKFDKLVEKGIIKKRGYTLMTPEEIYLNRPLINQNLLQKRL